MMQSLAAIVFAILTIVALIHVYWGFGGLWPAHDPAKLSRTVVGVEASKMPSPAVTLWVAACIFCAGCIPLAWLGLFPAPVPQSLLDFAMIILAGVFLCRGFVTYTPLAAKYSTVEPFVTLNKRFYSPLCLFIGACIILIYRA